MVTSTSTKIDDVIIGNTKNNTYTKQIDDFIKHNVSMICDQQIFVHWKTIYKYWN